MSGKSTILILGIFFTVHLWAGLPADRTDKNEKKDIAAKVEKKDVKKNVKKEKKDMAVKPGTKAEQGDKTVSVGIDKILKKGLKGSQPQPGNKQTKAKEIKKEETKKEKVKKEEIIKISKLKKKTAEFSITRDIFSPFKGDFTNKPNARPRPLPPPPPPPKKEEKKEEKGPDEDVVDEIRSSVVYEGYVMRHGKNLALLTVSGEFYVVGAEDIILEKIKIIKVEKKMVTVEVESNTVEINLKGDDENEQQNIQ